MAGKTTQDARRVSDYNPNVEVGEVLDGIEGEEVLITTVYQEERQGQKGPYTLTVIVTDDGAIYHTGGPVVAEKLGNVPPDQLPVAARFMRRKSKNDPTRSYWDVE